MKMKLILSIFLLIILSALFFKKKYVTTDFSFKPIVKVENWIYIWDDDKNMDVINLELAG